MLAMIEEDERTSRSAWDRDPGPRKRLASYRFHAVTVFFDASFDAFGLTPLL